MKKFLSALFFAVTALIAATTASATSINVVNELENNHEEATAQLVEGNTKVNGYMDEERDYYRIELTETTAIDFTFNNIDRINGFKWSIYSANDYNFQNINNDTHINVASSTKTKLVLKPGTYYIEISNNVSQGSYTLQMNKKLYHLTDLRGMGSSSNPFLLENNTIVNEVSSSYDDDIDYYQIELSKRSRVTLTISNTDHQNGFNWYIYPRTKDYYFNHINENTHVNLNTSTKFSSILSPGTYYVRIQNEDYVGRYTLKTLINSDIQKPVFKGISNKIIKRGQAFSTTKGISAIDNKDGNITKKIKISGKVNSKKKGIYTLTYTVTDKAGNKSIVKRKITVK